MEKIEIARRQLGTALYLFIENLDPVSIHSLAGNARELLDRLAENSGAETFRDHVRVTFPTMSDGEYFSAANLYRNAFKHLDRPNDQEVIEDFTDEQNKHLLFVCWYSYANLVEKLPIEAQCFQAWYYALEPSRIYDGDVVRIAKNFFGDMSELSYSLKKQCLKRAIQTARQENEIMSDEKTESATLVCANVNL